MGFLFTPFNILRKALLLHGWNRDGILDYKGDGEML